MARASRDVPPVGDSALALRTASLEPGLSWTLGDPDDDLLVYVAAGAGLLSVGGTSEPVQARSAGLVEDAAAREPCEIHVAVLTADLARLGQTRSGFVRLIVETPERGADRLSRSR